MRLTLLPTFGNKAKPTVETKTEANIANISVEVDKSKPMMPIKEVESTTFVTMDKDAVKDNIQIDTTEKPTTTLMLVTLDEVRGSKRTIEDTAQDAQQHSPKTLKNI